MRWKPRFPRIRLPSAGGWRGLLEDLLLLVGVAMLARGLWLIYPPVMWIFVGLLLMWAGLTPGRGK